MAELSAKLRELFRCLRDGKIHSALDVKDLSRADLVQKDAYGYTPLHYAVRLCDDDLLNMIFSKISEKDLLLLDMEENTALHYAAMNNSVRGRKILTQLLIKAGDERKKLVSSKNRLGNTAIHHATMSGNVEAVRLLLNYDTNELVNLQNKSDRTALHIATELGFKDIMRELLDAGADVKIQDVDGLTPFLVACKNRHHYTLDIYIEYDAATSEPDKLGRYPLHLAAMSNSIPTIELFLKTYGEEDLFKRDNCKNTVLHLAAESGSPISIETLLKHCRDDEERMELMGENSNAMTPLILACNYGNFESVHLLLCAESGIWRTGKDYETVFQLAVKRNYLKLLRAFARIAMKREGDEKQMLKTDWNGNTLLHTAAELGNDAIVELSTLKCTFKSYHMSHRS